MNRSLPTRSFFVIIGGAVGLTAWILGTIYCVPNSHRARFLSAEAVEMTYDQLIHGGLVDDNQHVRLVNVSIDQEAIQAQTQARVFRDAVADADRFGGFREATDHLIDDEELEALKKVPQVYVRANRPTRYNVDGRIRIDPVFRKLNDLTQEIAETGCLTGFYAPDPDANLSDDTYAFVFRPAVMVTTTETADKGLLIATLATVAGFILCGSGGGSLLAFLFFPAQVIVAMAGYPLRYQRGNATNRCLYLLVGGVALGIGVNMLWFQGGFGTRDGNLLLIGQGYAVGTLGLTMMCGAIFNLIAARMDFCFMREDEPASKTKTLTYDQACGMDPTASRSEPEYEDPRMREVNRDSLPSELGGRFLAELHQNAFGSLKTFDARVRVMVDAEAAKVAKSLHLKGEQVDCSAIENQKLTDITEADYNVWMVLGAGDMVAAMIEEDESRCVLRLVSVLNDGTTLITLSQGCKLQSNLRLGTHAIYARIQSDQAGEILEEHLQRTVRTAEHRGTRVTSLQASEMREIYLFSGRALNDVQHQYGESQLESKRRRYGRFQFPPSGEPIEGRAQKPGLADTARLGDTQPINGRRSNSQRLSKSTLETTRS